LTWFSNPISVLLIAWTCASDHFRFDLGKHRRRDLLRGTLR
jgi:hypothetical protein